MKRTKRNGVTIRREWLIDPLQVEWAVVDAEKVVRETRKALERQDDNSTRYLEPFALRVI